LEDQREAGVIWSNFTRNKFPHPAFSIKITTSSLCLIKVLSTISRWISQFNNPISGKESVLQ